MKVQTGDILFNDYYGYHVLVMDIDQEHWRRVYVFELSDYNFFLHEDFEGSGWTKMA